MLRLGEETFVLGDLNRAYCLEVSLGSWLPTGLLPPSSTFASIFSSNCLHSVPFSKNARVNLELIQTLGESEQPSGRSGQTRIVMDYF